MTESHVLNGLEKLFCLNSKKTGQDLMLNITRLFHFIATCDQKTAEESTRDQITFFCQGLQSFNPDSIGWSPRIFTVFKDGEDIQKTFQTAQGPTALIRILDHKDIQVVLTVVGQIIKLCVIILDCSTVIFTKLLNLWKYKDGNVRQCTPRAHGVLANRLPCSQWIICQTSMVQDLVEYLRSLDPDFILYYAPAIARIVAVAGT
jgi:hypothetical protein